MPAEDTKILEFNRYQKFDRTTICYLCRFWMFNRII